MRYVHLLESLSAPDRYYTGLSGDLRARLEKHNAREVPHTAKYCPWR
jgi:predicted GIY-YIG superfamily endonuclease